MAEYVKNAWTYWKLAIFQGGNGWFIAVAAAFLGFTDGDEWKTPTMRYIRMVLFCLVAGAKYMEGFLNQTVSRLRSGQPPVSTGNDTQFLTKHENEKTN